MTIEPIEMPEPTHTEYQGFDEWAKKFRPIKNHFSKYPNETMFETFGEEVDFVVKADNKYVWTWLQGDMSDLVCAGYHYVNRLGYFITEVPWEDDMDYALLSVEVECECYNEDGYENGEMGLADCSKCEGYGLVRTYVGE